MSLLEQVSIMRLWVSRNKVYSTMIIVSVILAVFICGSMLMMIFGQYFEQVAIRNSIYGRTLQVVDKYLPGYTSLIRLSESTLSLPKTALELDALKAEINGIEFAFLEERVNDKGIVVDNLSEPLISDLCYSTGDYFQGLDLELLAGSLPPAESVNLSNEVLINWIISDSIPGNIDNQIGTKITIEGLAYTVAGVVKRKQDPFINALNENVTEQNRTQGNSAWVYIPGDQHFLQTESQQIRLSIIPIISEVEEVVTRLEQIIESERFGQTRLITSFPRQRLLGFEGDRLTFLALSIYIASIVIGGLVVMFNVQLNRIRQSTNEVAFMISIGISRARILGEKMLTTCFLSAIGTAIGLALLRLSYGMIPQHLKPYMNENIISCSVALFFWIIFSVLLGLVPGIISLKTDILTGKDSYE